MTIDMSEPAMSRSPIPPLGTTGPQRVSVVIITQNEVDRLVRAVASCRAFADEIVVIDGGSTDDTVAQARALGCAAYENPWPGYAKQRNFGIERATHPWIFMLDSDEIVDDELAAAINRWKTAPLAAYALSIRRIGDFLGRWMDGGKSEYHVRLHHREKFTIPDVLVHEKPDVGSHAVQHLGGTMWHYGFRSVSDALTRFDRYTDLEAAEAARTRRFSALRLLLRPPARFVQRYFWQGLFRKGYAGLTVAVLWSWYEFLREIKLYEIEWRRHTGAGGSNRS